MKKIIHSRPNNSSAVADRLNEFGNNIYKSANSSILISKERSQQNLESFEINLSAPVRLSSFGNKFLDIKNIVPKIVEDDSNKDVFDVMFSASGDTWSDDAPSPKLTGNINGITQYQANMLPYVKPMYGEYTVTEYFEKLEDKTTYEVDLQIFELNATENNLDYVEPFKKITIYALTYWDFNNGTLKSYPYCIEVQDFSSGERNEGFSKHGFVYGSNRFADVSDFLYGSQRTKDFDTKTVKVTDRATGTIYTKEIPKYPQIYRDNMHNPENIKIYGNLTKMNKGCFTGEVKNSRPYYNNYQGDGNQNIDMDNDYLNPILFNIYKSLGSGKVLIPWCRLNNNGHTNYSRLGNAFDRQTYVTYIGVEKNGYLFFNDFYNERRNALKNSMSNSDSNILREYLKKIGFGYKLLQLGKNLDYETDCWNIKIGVIDNSEEIYLDFNKIANHENSYCELDGKIISATERAIFNRKGLKADWYELKMYCDDEGLSFIRFMIEDLSSNGNVKYKITSFVQSLGLTA